MINQRNSTFIKSISILTSGSIIAQMIIIISAPILTRLYSPEEIGAYTYIMSISHIFMAIINGRYDMSIVTEKDEKKVFALIKLSLIVSSILSILISFGYGVYFNFFSTKTLINNNIIIILFLIIFSYGLINVLNAYNNREKKYVLMSSLYIFRSATQNFGAIIFSILNIKVLGLLIPYTFGQFIGIKRQAKSLFTNFNEIKNIQAKDVLEVAILHKKQPIFSAPALFANSFSYASITIFIEMLFGMGVVGLYSVSLRVLGIPLSIISGNVSKVFYEDASREYNRTGQFFKSFKKTVIFLSILALPMVATMIYIVPPLVTLVFGDEWREAGKYIKILSPMFGVRFIVSSISVGLLVAQKQNYEFIIQILFIFISIITYIIANYLELEIIGYLSIISITFTIIYLFNFIIIYKISIKN
ncbi:lipopolysaccharide biosynthesis protein [Petrocella sp. FN5]|uniref:lipopolysaccharide biosynthesis protein n=1 Tax=Petrocella sp. FN5 TaxID=3032002 RepID=UPI0023DBA25A|nr:oligosaccharide flippase family protein [Petrocella sp. FN5]MDF1618738.1 oligosaccharide flippase family protein [Petrocella sp. FN5]